MKITVFFLFSLSAFLTGCGKGTADNTTITTAPANATRMLLSDFFAAPSDNRTALTQLAICVKRVQIDGDDDLPIKKTGEVAEDGTKDPSDIKFSPGLIKLITAGQPTSTADMKWGTVTLPTGFKVKRIKMKVKKDAALCTDATFDPNGDSSVYGIRTGNSIFSMNNDVEFKFKFTPSIDIGDGTVLKLTLDTFITAIKDAAAASDISGNNLKTLIETKEGTATKN